MAGYRLRINDLNDFEMRSEKITDAFTPNIYLYSILKEYLKKKSITSYDPVISQEQSVNNIKVLGLLMWNYFFSKRDTEKSSGELSESIFEKIKIKKRDNTMFQIEFADDLVNQPNDQIIKIHPYRLLPWELIYWPDADDYADINKGNFLFYPPEYKLIRKIRIKDQAGFDSIKFSLKSEESLKILMIVAGVPETLDYDQNGPDYAPLQYIKVKDSLLKVCKNIRSEIKIISNAENIFEQKFNQEEKEGTISSDKNMYADIEVLKGVIGDYKPHIIHLITHGETDESGRLNMVFNEGEGDVRLQKIDHNKWLEIFKDQNLKYDCKPKLIFLQVCQSGQSICPIELSKQNVPAVISMFYDINQDTANEFAAKFYNDLLTNVEKDRQTVCEAFHRNRKDIFDKVLMGERDFGMPIIYYNLEDDTTLISKVHISDPLETQMAKELSDAYRRMQESKKNAVSASSQNLNQKMIVKFNAMMVENPDEKSLHQIIEEAFMQIGLDDSKKELKNLLIAEINNKFFNSDSFT